MKPEAGRPRWSVMIPAYNPSQYLVEALESVICQVTTVQDFQIAVVDDSPDASATKPLIEKMGEAGIEYYRNESNLGLAGNWNRCIELARGCWVHILHQDDFVYPGFYAAMAKADEGGTEVGMVFCRNAVLDDGDLRNAEPEMDRSGLLRDWLERLAVRQRVQCAGVAVRRDVYARLGGFSDDLCYALDWEMWARIARSYAVWYEPEVLACYRVHGDSETARLSRAGATVDDEYRAARMIAGYLPTTQRRRVWPVARREIARRLTADAARLMRNSRRRDGMRLLYKAIRVDPGLLLTPEPFGFFKWNLNLLLGRD